MEEGLIRIKNNEIEIVREARTGKEASNQISEISSFYNRQMEKHWKEVDEKLMQAGMIDSPYFSKKEEPDKDK